LHAFGYGNGNPVLNTDPRGEFVPAVILGGIIVWEALTIHHEVTHPGETLGDASRAVHKETMQYFERQGQQTAAMSQSPGLGATVATGGQFAANVAFGLPSSVVNLATQPRETLSGVASGVKTGAVACAGAFTSTGDARLSNVGKCSGFVGGTIATAVGGYETLNSFAARGVSRLGAPDPEAWSPLNTGGEAPNPLGSFSEPVVPAGPLPKGAATILAARAAADVAQATSKRPPGAAAALTVGDRTFTATSKASPAHNPKVKSALDSIPQERRSPFHGSCAEPQCISQALDAGVERGGRWLLSRYARPGSAVMVSRWLHVRPARRSRRCSESRRLGRSHD
jgi:hypothetical protein